MPTSRVPLHLQQQFVRVHTTLPPGILGKPHASLQLSISMFRWTNSHPIASLRGRARENQTSVGVHVVWWGEDSNGCVFRPRIAGETPKQVASSIIKTKAKYQICVPLNQLYAYLSGELVD